MKFSRLALFTALLLFLSPCLCTAEETRPIFSMHGSNTIGARLGPVMVQAFLRQIGATDIQTRKEKTDETVIEADVPGHGKSLIHIRAHGSSLGFNDLIAGKCDIVMSSRRVSPLEIETGQKAGLGKLDSRLNEHVIGIDGIAVIVHKANPLERLSIARLTDIFSGKITNWKTVGGRSQSIQVCTRDNNSGTCAVFQEKILAGAAVTPKAKAFDNNDALSKHILLHPSAIGFVGLPYVGANRSLALYEGNTIPLRPSVFTVRTEDYFLSRRLFLYQSESPLNAVIPAFIQFALGDEGQKLVKLAGFVDLSLFPKDAPAAEKETIQPIADNETGEVSDKGAAHDLLFIEKELMESILKRPDIPDAYQKIAAEANRLRINFRFKTGSSDLDNLALADIERLIGFSALPRFQNRPIILAGFADSRGDSQMNLDLSRKRAETVQNALSMAGLPIEKIVGFGESLPVGSNETPEGQALNRRVEVWLKTP